MIIQKSRCPNLNHRRSYTPVRFCPMCGDVVNGDIPVKICAEEKHAKDRRKQNKYCVNCGEQLIQGR